MNTLIFCNNQTTGPQQDLSSPEDETAGSFHTPNHASITNASSMYSVLTSQDSIDVFHDAFSTLHFPQKTTLPPILHSPSREPHQRRRHFSSGAKFEDERIGVSSSEGPEWEEVDEQTCMLPKGPVARVRHSSQGRGQVSRSCNGSPFHVPRLSLSTNSLKRKSADRISWSNSPQKQTSNVQGGTMMNFVPYVEVEMIKETDEGEGFKGESKGDRGTPSSLDNGEITTPLSNSTTPSPSGNLKEVPKERIQQVSNGGSGFSNWKKNYVPCAELATFLQMGLCQECKAETQIKTEQQQQQFYSSKPIRGKRKTWQRIKEEFALTNFKFNHRTPHLFVTSQWQQPNQMCCMYLAYRLFWGVYFTMWGVWSWVGFAGYNSPPSMKSYYLVYLTNWGIWLLAFDTLFQAVNVALHMKKISEDGEAKYFKMKTSFKISWILSNITSTLHIFVTLIFWAVIFPHGQHTLNPISVNTHIIPGIYIILDCFISATPRRIFHAYLPMGISTVYGICSCIYYLAGGISHRGHIALYPFLNWSQPSKTLLVGSAMVLLLIPFIHILIVSLYGLRVKLWRNLNYTRYDQEVIETIQSVSMEEKV